ncbi:adenosylcobinamide-GDP ribazoletransferase [Salipaludibacillus aurantiacus]|uniref:Adenosylcobinamide-GDP ribazoletransferase n=1 Tax=Salipaludibacillus aurantiacus TaxID=1601833 RepID=A0A1H9SE30_9BACI|nr:adenosylcobinamide-GDP ribazoletransferase [Salipaludibacillus aurantiacus]SER83300.1 adenosylcobinamide-GDP ribazoletransferase [Salipaludibacillus aurantiacus]
MKNPVYGFLLAVQFLTRIPVPVECPWTPETSRWAIRCYPLVGIAAGGILLGLSWGLSPFLPAEMMALMIVTLWVWLTGGLHLDGVMDVADAAGSNAPLKKKWEIMKDPHVGSFGIVALFFLLGWKTMLVYMLIGAVPAGSLLFLVMIPALARFVAACLLILLPAAKKEGLAWHWKQNTGPADLLAAFLPAAVLVFFLPEYWVILPVFAAGIGLYGWWTVRTFKGINGDLTGTAIEGGELWGLLLVWIFTSFVTG